MSKFFINRPIVAMVISIVMVLVGSLTVLSLPVAQFPNITPPEIQVIGTYVGADAQTLEQAVATPIEQQMNGVDNSNYMYSLNATGNNTTSLIVDFDVKTDPNTDLMLTFDKSVTPALDMTASVGGNIRSFSYNSNFASTDYLNVPGWYNLNNSLYTRQVFNFNSARSKWR